MMPSQSQKPKTQTQEEDPKPPDDKDVYTEVFEPWFGLDPETAKRIEAEKTDEGPGGRGWR